MKFKILTVDDSKTIRMIVAKALKPFNCEVFEAANGVEGLTVANNHRPHLIVLDYTMPLMDGAEMLSRLRSDPELKSIPVLMLTAEAGRENILKIAKMGVRDYLVKPFKEDLLIERIGRIIDLKILGEDNQRTKRFDDPLKILLVDDKPKILEQTQLGLAETKWLVEGRTQTGETLDYCNHSSPDAVLLSLSLPNDGGFTLFQMLRSTGTKSKGVPILGLCVKTAAEEQARAQQMGFSGIVTKPIDFKDLITKISRALNLDTSYKYFEQRDGALLVRCPAQGAEKEIFHPLPTKISEAVDAGLDKLVIDLREVMNPSIDLIKLVLSSVEICAELSVKHRIVASPIFRQQCNHYEETKHWQLSDSVEEALSTLHEKTSPGPGQ